jgi:D-alanyl-D-alanine carboxypeptidase
MVPAYTQNRAISVFLVVVIAGLFWPAWAAPQAALVVDAATDTILIEHNANQPRHPASLTKMMTLYLVFDAIKQRRLSLQQPLKVSKRAAARPPSKLGLRAGSTITVEQIILALVTRSANDAATVVAEALGKTESQFARMMTQTARHLGMQKTTFRNASGLPDSRQITTAWDMYLLARALQKDFPEYYHYFSKTSFRFGKKTHRSHNHLLATYAGADGIKTGYIRASGYNLVTSVKRDGKHLVGVIFGGDTAKGRDAHMHVVLDQGFTQLAANESTPPVELPMITLIAKPTSPAVMVPTQAASLTLVSFDPKQTSVLDQGSSNADEVDWKVQVGAFSHIDGAKQRVSEVVQTSLGILSSGQAIILPKTQDGKVLYRALFKGFTEIEASGLCDVLEQYHFDCFPLAPSNG